jgi:hypothetical protein
VAAFEYPHSAHKELRLSNADLPNAAFSRKLSDSRIGPVFTVVHLGNDEVAVVYFKVTVTSDEGKSLKAFRIVTGT